MPAPRATALDLARHFDAVAQPIYAVGHERRIIFVNGACADWLGQPAAAIVGRECRYHTSDQPADDTSALAAALCPPPEALAGARVMRTLVIPRASGESEARRCEFVPLVDDESQPAMVLAVVETTAAAAESEPAAEHDPTRDELHAEIARYRGRYRERYDVSRLVGASAAMRRVRAQVDVAARSAGTVLIVGPVGSGRQHVARAIHYAAGARTPGTLVPLACAFLGAELLQATIRTMARAGRTAIGERPRTLVLNDIERLPAEGRSELAGFVLTADLPFRVAATAERSLVELAERGEFPRELAMALSTLVIEIPPLAERAEDIPLLAQLVLEECNARGGKQVGGFSDEALDRLAAYAWRGEVDELAQVVVAAHAAAESPLIGLRDLDERVHLAANMWRRPRRPEERIVLDELLSTIERELIERALERAKGNKTKAAHLLGMTRPRLYRRLIQLGMADEAADFVEQEADAEIEFESGPS